jgi:hypothetical protein
MSVKTKKNRANYRKIWEKHNGPIPIDEDGRSYHIHHIDGDKHNNQITNLLCVTIQEHYDIHYSQGDWYACHALQMLLDIDPDEQRKLMSKAASARYTNGTHNWLNINEKMLENGTHPSQVKFCCVNCQREISGVSRLDPHWKKCTAPPKVRPLIFTPSQVKMCCTNCKKEISLSGFSQHTTACFKKSKQQLLEESRPKVHKSKGKTYAVDAAWQHHLIYPDDIRVQSGELKLAIGVKDGFGNHYYVPRDDPIYLAGHLKGTIGKFPFQK